MMNKFAAEKKANEEHAPTEVWVTHYGVHQDDPAGQYISGVSEEPWPKNYTAPITQWAAQSRYVLAEKAVFDREETGLGSAVADPQIIVPYGAVVHDEAGQAWVFTSYIRTTLSHQLHFACCKTTTATGMRTYHATERSTLLKKFPDLERFVS